MSVTYNNTLKNTRLTAVRDAIDAGAGAGKLEIGTAGMGSVLATIALADPCGSVANQVLTLTMPRSDTSADATGTAAHFRLYASDGTTCHAQGTVTVTAGGGDMTVDSTSFTTGGTFSVTGFTLTAGNA